jgi:hypothetical protein
VLESDTPAQLHLVASLKLAASALHSVARNAHFYLKIVPISDGAILVAFE